MKGFYIFLVLCQVFASRGLSTDEQINLDSPNASSFAEENERGRRIVGGRPAKDGELPYLVFVGQRLAGMQKLFHHCGGSIIDRTYILTAAHCVNRLKGDLAVLAGRTTLPSTGDVAWNEALDVSAYSIHPDYDENTNENDVAIMRLAQPLIVNNKTIAIATLNADNDTCPDTATKQKCTVSGWGKLDFRGPLSNTAMAVNVTAISTNMCQLAYYDSSHIGTDKMCAGELGIGHKDSCMGDSGGPLTCRCDGRDIVAGVVSYGVGCARPDKPGVYSRVSHNLDWITSVLRSPRLHSWVQN